MIGLKLGNIGVTMQQWAVSAESVPILQMNLIDDLVLQLGVGVATFTRSTIGTAVNRVTGIVDTLAIDVARFESEGVLLEGASTSPLLRSEEFDNVAWEFFGTASGLVTGNTSVAPDGTTTADTISFNAGDNRFGQSITAIGAVPYTSSIWLSAPVDADYELWIIETGSLFTRKVVSLTSTPERFDVSHTPTGAVTLFVEIATLGDGTVADGTRPAGSIIAWGSPLEELPFASSYIETIASPVSRGEDSLSIVAANIPAPADDYTVSMEVDVLGLDPTKTFTVYNVDGETSRKCEINTTTGLIEATHGAVTVTSTTVMVPGIKHDIKVAVDATNILLFVDGVPEAVAVKGTVTGTATAIAVGNAAGLDQIYGHVKFFKIFDSFLRTLIAFQRIFITIDAAQEGHYLLENPVVATGDFSYSFLFAGTSLDTFDVFMSDSNSGQITARVNGSLVLECEFGDGAVGVAGTTSLNDGKLHLCTITRVGQIGSVFVDGDLENSVDNIGILGDQIIDVFGRRFGANDVSGIMANVDLGNGNAWKLDRATGNTQQAVNGNNLLTLVNIPEGAPDRELLTFNQSANKWVGVEVWSAGDSISDGSEGAFTTIVTLGNILVIGASYSISAIASGFTSGSQQFRLGGTTSTSINSDGAFAEDLIATTPGELRTRVGASQANNGATLSEISAKRFIEVA